jgi:acyl carrier protein
LKHSAVEERVQEIFRSTLSVQVPSSETDLIDAGVLDSLTLVELLFQIEREFSVSIPLDDLELESFTSIRRISDLIVSMNGHGPG